MNDFIREMICARLISCEICMPTGWRRLIGSPKLQIIFHKRATKYRSLLRKMTHKDKGAYESSPPCNPIYNYVLQQLLTLLSWPDA